MTVLSFLGCSRCLKLVCQGAGFVVGVFALFMWPHHVSAQVYRFKTYTSHTGLPANNIYCLFQDRLGNIWFGTDNGACRYDGKIFTTISIQQGLAGRSVRAMFEDRQGRIWFTTEDGVSCLEDNKFVNYTTLSGLAANATYSGMTARDGSIWVGGIRGLSRFDGSKFVTYIPPENQPAGPIWDLAEDRNGNIWMALRGGGLSKFDGIKFTSYRIKEGLPNDHCIDVEEDPKSGIWVTTGNGLCFFDGMRFQTYTTADGLGDARAGRILFDHHGRLWCGTFGGGLSRLEGDRFITFTMTNGLPNNYLTAILEDYEGSLWCGTSFGGAFRLSDENFSRFSGKFNLGEGRIGGLGETLDGTLWSASLNDGLYALDSKGVIRRYGVKDGMLEEAIWRLFVDSKDRVWLGGQNGVSCFYQGRFRNFTREETGASERITAITEDRQGNLWFGSYSLTGNGIIRFDGQTFRRFTTKDGLISNSVNALNCDRNGNLWICTDAGLCRFDGRQFTTYQSGIGISGRQIKYVFEDKKGLLWIGTDNGLYSFNGKAFQTYPSSSAMTDKTIRAIAETDDLLWIGTGRGISSFDGVRFRSFTSRDGYLSDEVSYGACLARSDGSLWFGTSSGLVRYKPALDIARETPPRLHIEGVYAQEHAPNLFPASRGPTVEIRALRYFENSLTFEFVAPSFVDEEAVEYSFRLVGFDDQWSLPRSERRARFTNLPSGTYRFEVKATSASNLWSEPTTVAFTVQPAPWRTWWAYLFYGIAGVGVIYAGVQLRVHELRRGQKKLEAKIRERTLELERFRLLIRKSHSIVMLTDAEDKILWVNDSFVRNTGYGSDEVLGKKPGDFLAGPETDPAVVEKLRRAFEERTPLETEIYNYRKDGSGYWGSLFVSPVFDDAGEFQGFISIHIDITERKRLEEEHTRLMLAVQQTPSIVLITNKQDRIEWVNRGFTRITGYTFEEVVGRKPASVLRGPETNRETAKFIADSVRAQKPFECELFNYGKDGGGYWVTISVAPYFNREGVFQGFVSIQSDITRLKELEQALAKSQAEAVESARAAREASQAKSAFLANMSHELRTPLNAVLGFAQILQRDPSLGTEQRKHVSTILAGGKHLLGLINDVLSISKIEAGKTTLNESEFNLPALLKNIEDMLKLRARAKNLTLVFDPSPTLPTWVRGDEGKLRQILVNLLGNAVKFTERGSIVLRAAWDNDITEFEVEDTGPGIAEDEIGKLFEPFVQTAEGRKAAEGTGLGLAISRNFVRLMNGDIRVSSRLGKGTIFSFEVELPRVADRDMSPASERIVGLAPGQPRFRLLVADDKPENRAVLVNLLTPLGFDLREAHDGAEAVRLFAEWRPDLIWMDIRMPVLDGLEATRRIRELEAASDSGRPTVIVAVSASAFEHERDTCRVAGCTAFLPKPFQAEAIFEALTRHLGVRFTTDEDTPQATESESPVGPERFAALPEDWVAALHAAAQAGNRKAAGDAIEKIKARDAQLAGALADLLKNYRFDDIAELIEANGAHPNES